MWDFMRGAKSCSGSLKQGSGWSLPEVTGPLVFSYERDSGVAQQINKSILCPGPLKYLSCTTVAIERLIYSNRTIKYYIKAIRQLALPTCQVKSGHTSM